MPAVTIDVEFLEFVSAALGPLANLSAEYPPPIKWDSEIVAKVAVGNLRESKEARDRIDALLATAT